jgi:hypothetical protein
MPASVTIQLDTSAPAEFSADIEGGEEIVLSQLVEVDLSTVDADLAHVKLWGDVDPDYDPNVQTLEEDSAWVVAAGDLFVRLAASGAQTLYVRARDDVYNETDPYSDQVLVALPEGPAAQVTTTDAAATSGRSRLDFATRVVAKTVRVA